jgi:hypothetical protein
MRKTFSTISFLTLIIMMGCAPTSTLTENTEKWKPKYTIQLGIAHGGIIENTDLKQIPNTDIDAFTGATSKGPNVGVHVKFPIYKNDIESGIDYLNSKQIFRYNDNVNGYNGKRNLNTSQLMVPLTYNFNLLRKIKPGGLFSLKLGMVFQYNIVNIDDNQTTLPTYSINSFSKGMVFGISSTPYSFSNGSKLGLFLDFYRGSRIYTDFYNQEGFKMPASSFAKTGIIFQF